MRHVKLLTLILHSGLILCLGGLLPLVLTTNFSAHHEVPTYQFSFADGPLSTQRLLRQRAALPQLAPPVASTYQRSLPAAVYQFQTLISQMMHVTQAPPLNTSFLIGRLTAWPLVKSSAIVPPPDKPPQL